MQELKWVTVDEITLDGVVVVFVALDVIVAADACERDGAIPARVLVLLILVQAGRGTNRFLESKYLSVFNIRITLLSNVT